MKNIASEALLLTCWLVCVCCSEGRTYLRTSEMPDLEKRFLSNDNEVRHPQMNSVHGRKLFDDTEPIPVSIHPFTVTINPTADPLEQFQIDEIGEMMKSVVLAKLQTDNSFLQFNLVEGIEFDGAPVVAHTPRQVIDEFKVLKPKSTLTYVSGGTALVTYSSLGDVPSSHALSNAFLEIIEDYLLAALREGVDGLELIEVVYASMDAPPTLTPTKGPTPSPIRAPSQMPTKSPTLSPTVTPTWKPTALLGIGNGFSTLSPTFEQRDEKTPMPSGVEAKDIEGLEDVDADANSGKFSTIRIFFGVGVFGLIFLLFLLCRRRRKARHDSQLEPLGANMVVSRGKRNGRYNGDSFGDVNDGDSTQTPDTLEAKAFGSPSSSALDLATPPKSKGASKKSEWFGKLPGKKSPALYFPIHITATNDEISRFDDNPKESIINEELPSNHSSEHSNGDSVPPDALLVKQEESSFLQDNWREGSNNESPSYHGDTIAKSNSDAVISHDNWIMGSGIASTPSNAANSNEDGKVEAIFPEPPTFPTTPFMNSVLTPPTKTDELTLEAIHNSDKSSTIAYDVENEVKAEIRKEDDNLHRVILDRTKDEGKTGDSEGMKEGGENEFPLDAIWDPNDTEEDICFDEPQFEPPSTNTSVRLTESDEHNDSSAFGVVNFTPENGFSYDDSVADAENQMLS